MNKVILMGRLTRDPELRHTQSDVPVASFSLAVDRGYSRRDDSQQNVDFINIVAWRQQAEFVTRYFRKGSSICVVGTIQNRTWTDTNGQKRYATDIIAEEVQFVDSRGEQQGQAVPPAPEWTEVSADEGLPF